MTSFGRAILALLALCCAGVANAAQQCKPVVGSFEALVQPPDTCSGPLCTAGRVWGGVQGTYRFTMDKIIPNGEPEVPTIMFFTGHSSVSLRNGDPRSVPTRERLICLLEKEVSLR
jgi:hypothetical protein